LRFGISNLRGEARSTSIWRHRKSLVGSGHRARAHSPSRTDGDDLSCDRGATHAASRDETAFVSARGDARVGVREAAVSPRLVFIR
jgi:hypothetical protein